jgi:hypothetical protein
VIWAKNPAVKGRVCIHLETVSQLIVHNPHATGLSPLKALTVANPKPTCPALSFLPPETTAKLLSPLLVIPWSMSLSHYLSNMSCFLPRASLLQGKKRAGERNRPQDSWKARRCPPPMPEELLQPSSLQLCAPKAWRLIPGPSTPILNVQTNLTTPFTMQLSPAPPL